MFRIENSLVNHKVLDVKKETTHSGVVLFSQAPSILLLGDSFTKGLGIGENDRIANQLRSKGLSVIDSSKSGDNWTDYYRTLITFEQFDSVDFLVIGVNWNDVGFPVGQILNSSGKKDTIKPRELKHVNTEKGIKSIIPNIYASKLISTLSGNIQNKLKRMGYPLPIGNFHYFRTDAYKEHRQDLDLVYSKFLELSSVYDVNIILYLMPDFNLLNRPEYFETFTDGFNYNNSSVYVINGIDKFKDAKDGEYCISIQDGHPNADASKKIASEIILLINQIQSSF